jgi:hypothetical protein
MKIGKRIHPGLAIRIFGVFLCFLAFKIQELNYLPLQLAFRVAWIL